MPGFILHMTSARMLMQQSDKTSPLHYDEETQKKLFIGSILPDASTDKRVSHFREKKSFGTIIEYPDPSLFYNKYKDLLSDPVCLGFYFHLYIDYRFFTDYLPNIVVYMDDNGWNTMDIHKVTQVYVKKTGLTVPIKQFLSKEYYYGDYTKMNTYLIHKYNLPMNLNPKIENPGIEEANIPGLSVMLDMMHGFLNVPESAAMETQVFDMKELLDLLEKWTQDFIESF